MRKDGDENGNISEQIERECVWVGRFRLFGCGEGIGDGEEGMKEGEPGFVEIKNRFRWWKVRLFHFHFQMPIKVLRSRKTNVTFRSLPEHPYRSLDREASFGSF